jgi:hypothetical protein
MTVAVVSMILSPRIVLGRPVSRSAIGPANVSPAVPTRNCTSPGSTIRSMVHPANDNRSVCTLKDTSADADGASRTRANPIGWVIGQVRLATESAAYSCTTSAPRRPDVMDRRAAATGDAYYCFRSRDTAMSSSNSAGRNSEHSHDRRMRYGQAGS